MKGLLLSSVALLGLSVAANAGPPPPPLPVWDWTGGYIGAHTGGAWGTTHFSDPFGPSIYGDDVSTPAYIFGAQIGFNWQAPHTPSVFGVEADASAFASAPGGTNTCLAFSGQFISANCRVHVETTTTFTGRVGFATGPQGRTLLYVKGGLAGVDDHIDIATNANLPPLETSATVWKWGGTVGAGIEEALTPAWSVRLEYDYLGFGRNSMATPSSFVQTGVGGAYVATAGNTTSVGQNVQEVKLGLNYKWGAPFGAFWPEAGPPASAFPVKAPPLPAWAPGWEFEGGGRYWYSYGKFQKDLGTGTSASTANVLNSRLTYDSIANSGEVFGRIDSPSRLFVKGFVGGGSLSSGHMNDEDWNLPGIVTGDGPAAYSNTISNPVKGSISYGTIDGGFNFLEGPWYKVGGFVGYNYYRDDKSAYGCVQIAAPNSDCSAANPAIPPVPSSTLGITENDTWKSLRLGTNAEFMPFPGVKVSGDVAYLPYVQFNGIDNHVLRSILSPETGRGEGVQLEAILSYYITPAFSVGVGGRYWAMWTNDSAYTNFGGAPCPCQTLPAKTERDGVFVQAAYKFGIPAAIAAKN
jgi:opacity protein-like surface antigen